MHSNLLMHCSISLLIGALTGMYKYKYKVGLLLS